MRMPYRLFRKRSGIYFLEDHRNKKQESLRTRDKAAAKRILAARNEACQNPAINLQIARSYLMVSDPLVATRTWGDVVKAIISTKQGPTRHRWERAAKDKALRALLALRIIETQAEQFLDALNRGTVSTNVFLRKLHNFALGMNWLPAPIIPTRQWPAVRYQEKRGITFAEHRDIVERERNPERRLFYELLWHTGGSQTDIANLRAEDVNRKERVIAYSRRKTGAAVLLRYGAEVVQLLEHLPVAGPLFPYLRTVRSGDRATEFKQRCQGLGIKGVTLHSYRYAWAERARAAGYPERFAQEALGHNSKAVHRAYAKKAHVLVPALEDYEKDAAAARDKVIPVLAGARAS